ncbi:MAG TPA: tetratricopeptide repeat protein [Candidatus Udaeobacter sp.]|jgi:tetratricopeptide (TPR) repeat protein|nr:tetratricopeptide repeat protein [Candidatus Udaeobacter sp.]
MRRISPLFIAIFFYATVTDGNVPIVVATGDAKRKVMKLCSDASNQLRDGDVASAKRNINEALRIDPKLWPALYVRAEIFAREGKYELAIQDCDEALRQNRTFIDAALLRANINVGRGKYAEASKEFNSLIAMRPATVTLARALSERAWFQATCPDASFRNGQQAVKDAKAACSMVAWKDEDMIDTLAAAYAESGDFDSAVRYAQQALAIKDISPRVSKRIQGHLALFQRHQPIRSG